MNPMEELQAIRTRTEKATPGPWKYRPEKWDDWGWVRAGEYIIARVTDCKDFTNEEFDLHRLNHTDPYINNAQFVAHARTDIPVLLDEIERQRQRLQKAGQLIYRAIPARGDLDEMEKWYRDRDEFLQESKP